MFSITAVTVASRVVTVALRVVGLNDMKDKTIVTYCNGGYRGNIGADELLKKSSRQARLMAVISGLERISKG